MNNFKEKISKQITDKELQVHLEMQWDNLNDFERVEFFKTFNPNTQKIAIIQSTYVKMSLNLIVILHNK